METENTENKSVETGTENTSVTENTENKTYTQAEVDKLIQSEADKRVTDALKKADRKKADAIKEAQKLAAMNESEKYKYELDQREAAIADKEKQLALAENKNECAKILSDKDLPIGLVDFVVDVDADAMQTKIKTLDKYFKQAVKNEVDKRLSSNTPKKNLPTDGIITKDMFSKMGYSQRAEIARNNPELYQNLIH